LSDPKHTAVAIVEREERMHPVVRAAMAQSPTPETLRELLAVQREWEAGEARKAYTRALSELKRDLPTVIARDKEVKFANVRYTHTSLAMVMDAITGPLTAHGFSLSWEPKTAAGQVSVTCRLTHSEGHSEEATISSTPDKSGSKSEAQGVASTITLLQRYTALSLLGIATADMQEPQPTAPPASTIDTQRNLKAVGALKKYGKTKQDAEAFLGVRVEEWTTGDLGTLKAWLQAPPLADPPHDQQTGEVDHSYGPPPMTADESAQGEKGLGW